MDYPIGQVKVGGARLPIRTFVIGGVPVPVEWPDETEQRFLEWWRQFRARHQYAPKADPDHDSQRYDWRALWWLGFRDYGKRYGITYVPPVNTRFAVRPTQAQMEKFRRF